MSRALGIRSYLAGLTLALLLLAGGAGRVWAQDSGSQATPAANSSEAKQGEVDATEKYRHSAMVEKLGGMMGMNPEAAATTFEVLNFAVLAVLVGVFLARALPKTFRDRGSRIQRDLADARTATEEASARMSGIEDRLARLDGQIVALKAQSEASLMADYARIKASVAEETKKILASAEQEIAAATLHAQRSLQQQAAELAIEQAARKLVINAETDRLLVQDFARRLGSDDLKGQN